MTMQNPTIVEELNYLRGDAIGAYYDWEYVAKKTIKVYTVYSAHDTPIHCTLSRDDLRDWLWNHQMENIFLMPY